jgi:hypothetical protein
MISRAKPEEIPRLHADNLRLTGATEADCRIVGLEATSTWEQKQGLYSRYELHWVSYPGWRAYMMHTGAFASMPEYEKVVAPG